MKDVFERIYSENVWGNAESRSGDGSAAEHTKAVRAAIPRLVADFGVKSILDVPCGDFNWMRLVDLDIEYIGGDIVAGLIEANQHTYGRHGREFRHIDITKGPLPSADLVMCRDLLVHLSFSNLEAALENIRKSGARYLLATTFPSRDTNSDIKSGEWRPLNLQRPPFSFPPPIRLIDERCTEWDGYWADKCLGLWEVNALSPSARRDAAQRSLAGTDRTPRVSIIIPTFNRAHYIGRAVASALGQTFLDLEVIVVDDGSTDETPEVLASFKDPRLILIRQENAGRSRARNVAIERARGEYITFLDSDDYYLPSKVSSQVAFLDANREFGMAYTAASCIDGDGRFLNYSYRAALSGWIYPATAFFKPLTITLPTVMVRREVLSKVGFFDEVMVRFEDTDMWRRIAKITPVAGIDEITCHLRTHASNRLEAMDPEEIASAIDYYVGKVLSEDPEIDRAVLDAGARRLYEHYGLSMINVPAFAETGRKLLETGRGYFQPLVSIVIPVYNGANYLGLAIESALAQTYPNIEIVVVNDGSTDDGATERVASAYRDRIRYFERENGGVAAALNSAVREARGEYISWLSHDDLYTPDKIERQIARLVEQPDPGRCIVYGDYAVFSKDADPGSPVTMPGVASEDFRYFITTQNILHGCTLLIPKAAFARSGAFDERLRTTQDYDLWFRMAAQERFVHMPGVVVRARSHAEQGTLALSDIVMKEANELLTRFVENLTPDEIEHGASRPLVMGYLHIAASFRSRNFNRAAERSVALAQETAYAALQETIPSAPGELDNSGRRPIPGLEALIAAAGHECLENFSLRRRCDELNAQLRTAAQAQERHRTESRQAVARERERLRSELNRAFDHERDHLRAELHQLHLRLQAIYSSSSWKATRPLRFISRLLGRTAGALRPSRAS